MRFVKGLIDMTNLLMRSPKVGQKKHYNERLARHAGQMESVCSYKRNVALLYLTEVKDR